MAPATISLSQYEGKAAGVLAAFAASVGVLRVATRGFVQTPAGAAPVVSTASARLRASATTAAQATAGSTGAAPLQASSPGASAAVLGAVALAGAAAASRQQRRRRADAVQLHATRTEWYRRAKRIGGDRAVFDVTVPKPMGLKLELFPQQARKGMGVSQVVPGGNADTINRKVCVDDEPGMWVLEGDQLLAIDGTDCEDGTIDDVVNLVSNNGKDEVTLTLLRDTRKGPVKVVVMPDGAMETIRRGCRLSAAAEYAKGGELKYGCIDGWCGTCWHRERVTNMIFKPCNDIITEDWDNVMPLVIFPKPEKVGDSTFLNPRGAV